MDFGTRNTSTKRVDWFDDFGAPNKHRYLSNFFIGDPIVVREYGYFQTGEHLFAALKADNRNDFENVRDMPGPGAAKRMGRIITLRPDWEAVKYDVMRYVLALKFNRERMESVWLTGTGSKMLIEGNDWNDKVWGVNRQNGLGRNWLGVLLMARRSELVAEAKGAEIFDYTQTRKFIEPIWHKIEGDKKRG